MADLALYGSTLSVESMKVIAESIGVSALPDDAAKELADDVSFKVYELQVAISHLFTSIFSDSLTHFRSIDQANCPRCSQVHAPRQED